MVFDIKYILEIFGFVGEHNHNQHESVQCTTTSQTITCSFWAVVDLPLFSMRATNTLAISFPHSIVSLLLSILLFVRDWFLAALDHG